MVRLSTEEGAALAVRHWVRKSIEFRLAEYSVVLRLLAGRGNVGEDNLAS